MKNDPDIPSTEASDSDPRPVFQGDWQSATGPEKGAHSEAIRQWKLRQSGEAQSPVVEPTGQQGRRAQGNGSGDAASLAVLRGIRDDGNALDSDRLRAAHLLIQAERAEGMGEAQDSTLVQLRAVLETLEPAERLAWLQGERLSA